ncbi:MAG: enoyl-CoA hydratase/isomerase family protein [Henriciella sp.]
MTISNAKRLRVDGDQEVISEINGRAGIISLNQPTTLNALTRSMNEKITASLKSWLNDDRVELVILDHMPGSRGFCSGCDAPSLVAMGKSNIRKAQGFLADQQKLIHFIANYPKPCVAIIDGVTAGSGAGLSTLASHQVATENTLFALPETGMGWFPGCGATWFLPKLEGELGTWLALTGARLRGEDVVAVGLASHFCGAEEVATMKEGLCRRGVEALGYAKTRFEFSLQDKRSEMDEAFSGDSILDILRRLKSGSQWAKAQATKIEAKSPLSVRIALRLLRTGEYLGSLQDGLKIEYRIGSRLVHCRNFYEGVRATLIDKDHDPYWRPAGLRSMTFDMVAPYFRPLDKKELRLSAFNSVIQ